MTFTVTKLLNSRAVVQGTDAFGTTGQTIVSTHQWDEIKKARDFESAHEQFELDVQEFFKDLTDAADRAKAAVAGPEEDSLTYLVLEEGEQGSAPKPERRVQLDHDAQILRLIEQGDVDRLMWVGDNQLEILEGQPTLAQATATVQSELGGEVISDSKPAVEDSQSE